MRPRRIVWLSLVVVMLIVTPASAQTWVDWNCNGFTRADFTTLIMPVISSSPVPVDATGQFYISTANPRPGGQTPQHLRVQWNAANDWGGRLVLEGGTQVSRHLFVTMYVSHSATWNPMACCGAKQIVLKNQVSGRNHTYLQASTFTDRKPALSIQEMPLGNNNFTQNQGNDIAITPGGGYYRLDYEVQLNAPGQSDGIVRMYVNNIKRLEYLNVNMGATDAERFSAIDIDFLGSDPGTFPMYRDMDRLWISTTEFDTASGTLNAPSNPKICRGAGCTPALVLPLPLLAGLAIWIRRVLRRRSVD